jgi:hypothetical protein
MQDTTLTQFGGATPTDSQLEEEATNETEDDSESVVYPTVPKPYPSETIAALEDDQATYTLCVPDGEVETTYTVIGGRGGMGPSGDLPNADRVFSTAESLIGAPVLLFGGGMNAVGGGGALFGRLIDTTKASESVRVTLDPIFRRSGYCRKDERSAILGSYCLSVPATASDAQAATAAFTAWLDDDIDYLIPAKRETASNVKAITESFQSLSPGDKVQTPVYSTTLTVVSEPYDTYVRIRSLNFDDKFHSVQSVTVDNPRGGYYQLGLKEPSSQTSYPTCFMSRSSSSPPTPNTSFGRDAKFSSTDLEITANDQPVDVVPPDEEVIESPLPESCMRKSVGDIDGVGEKTTQQLFKELKTTDAHKLAFNLHGTGDDLHEADIVRALDGLSTKSVVLRELKQLWKRIDD